MTHAACEWLVHRIACSPPPCAATGVRRPKSDGHSKQSAGARKRTASATATAMPMMVSPAATAAATATADTSATGSPRSATGRRRTATTRRGAGAAVAPATASTASTPAAIAFGSGLRRCASRIVGGRFFIADPLPGGPIRPVMVGSPIPPSAIGPGVRANRRIGRQRQRFPRCFAAPRCSIFTSTELACRPGVRGAEMLGSLLLCHCRTRGQTGDCDGAEPEVQEQWDSHLNSSIEKEQDPPPVLAPEPGTIGSRFRQGRSRRRAAGPHKLANQKRTPNLPHRKFLRRQRNWALLGSEKFILAAFNPKMLERPARGVARRPGATNHFDQVRKKSRCFGLLFAPVEACTSIGCEGLTKVSARFPMLPRLTAN